MSDLVLNGTMSHDQMSCRYTHSKVEGCREGTCLVVLGQGSNVVLEGVCDPAVPDPDIAHALEGVPVVITLANSLVDESVKVVVVAEDNMPAHVKQEALWSDISARQTASLRCLCDQEESVNQCKAELQWHRARRSRQVTAQHRYWLWMLSSGVGDIVLHNEQGPGDTSLNVEDRVCGPRPPGAVRGPRCARLRIYPGQLDLNAQPRVLKRAEADLDVLIRCTCG